MFSARKWCPGLLFQSPQVVEIRTVFLSRYCAASGDENVNRCFVAARIALPPQVMEMGIETYNKHCRSIVTRYSKEWEKTIKRLGRWIDFENDYKTMVSEEGCYV